MSNRLEGKVALVTACTRGIGRAIADLFVDEGAKVYYACRNMETGKAAVEAARARGGQAELVYFEAHDPATHRSMIDECIAKEGRLDVLVNNLRRIQAPQGTSTSPSAPTRSLKRPSAWISRPCSTPARKRSTRP
ncbi:MAG: SDR family NAD(P)-dependent oxidoreductase [Oscillospiraceae bacterium]